MELALNPMELIFKPEELAFKNKPESRDGDIGIHNSNYYLVPSCRFENPAAH